MKKGVCIRLSLLIFCILFLLSVGFALPEIEVYGCQNLSVDNTQYNINHIEIKDYLGGYCFNITGNGIVVDGTDATFDYSNLGYIDKLFKGGYWDYNFYLPPESYYGEIDSVTFQNFNLQNYRIKNFYYGERVKNLFVENFQGNPVPDSAYDNLFDISTVLDPDGYAIGGNATFTNFDLTFLTSTNAEDVISAQGASFGNIVISDSQFTGSVSVQDAALFELSNVAVGTTVVPNTQNLPQVSYFSISVVGDAIIDNFELANFDGTGLYIGTANAVVINNSFIHDRLTKWDEIYSAHGLNINTDSLTIQNTRLSDLDSGASLSYVSEFIFEENEITNNAEFGLSVGDEDAATVTDNIICYNGHRDNPLVAGTADWDNTWGKGFEQFTIDDFHTVSGNTCSEIGCENTCPFRQGFCGQNIAGDIHITESLNCGFSFPGLKNQIQLYGDTTQVSCAPDVVLEDVYFTSTAKNIAISNCRFYEKGGGYNTQFKIETCPESLTFTSNTFENISELLDTRFTCRGESFTPTLTFVSNVFFKTDIELGTYSCAPGDWNCDLNNQAEASLTYNDVYCGIISLDDNPDFQSVTIAHNSVYGANGGTAAIEVKADVASVYDNYACAADSFGRDDRDWSIEGHSVFNNANPYFTDAEKGYSGIDIIYPTSVNLYLSNICQSREEYLYVTNYLPIIEGYPENLCNSGYSCWQGADGVAGDLQSKTNPFCGICNRVPFDCRQERLPTSLLSCPDGKIRGCDSACYTSGNEPEIDVCGACGGTETNVNNCGTVVSCGSADGSVSATPPTENLCAEGLSSYVSSSSTTHSWICNAFSNRVSCSAQVCPIAGQVRGCDGACYAAGSEPVVDVCGVCGGTETNINFCGTAVSCGSANGSVSATAPTENLCGDGIPSFVSSSSTTHTWSCYDLPNSISCSAQVCPIAGQIRGCDGACYAVGSEPVVDVCGVCGGSTTNPDFCGIDFGTCGDGVVNYMLQTVVDESFESWPLDSDWDVSATYPFGDATLYAQSGSHSASSINQDIHGSTSSISYTQSGITDACFWYRGSSEGGYDKFFFSVDGSYVLSDLSGTSEHSSWTQECVAVSPDEHTYEWVYSKDGSVSGGDDTFFIDSFVGTSLILDECDDGNTIDGDGCSAVCTNETVSVVCGDGILQGLEECDLGAGGSWGFLSEQPLTTQATYVPFVFPVYNGVAKTSDACNAPLSANECQLTQTVHSAISCGDGLVNHPSEECDFGTTYNTNTAYSSNNESYVPDVSAPAVCQSKTSHVCSPTCQATGVVRSTPASNVDIEMRLFEDTVLDNLDSNLEPGKNDVLVDFYEEDGGVRTKIGDDISALGTFPGGSFPWRNGVISVTQNIDPLKTYYFVAELSQTSLNGLTAVTPNVGGDELRDSDGQVIGGVIEAQVQFDLSCQQSTDIQFGLRPIVAGCGDGFLDLDGQNNINESGTGDDEQCDDSNTVSGDGCSNICKNEYCGDAIRDPNGPNNIYGDIDDEACDLGSTYNTNFAQSTVIEGFSAFNSGSVPACSEQRYYTCSPTCAIVTNTTYQQPRLDSVTLQVFADEGADGVDGSITNGIENVNVRLFENNAGSHSQVAIETTSNAFLDDGDADFSNVAFYNGRSYYFRVNASGNPLNGNSSTTHVGVGDIYDVPLVINSCQAADDEIGFYPDAYCNDGIVNQASEECDFGSQNNGVSRSSNQTNWVTASAPVCSVTVEYTCSPTCRSSTFVVSTPRTAEDLVAHAFNDTNRDALSNDGLFWTSKGIDGVDISLYEERFGTRTFLQTIATSPDADFTTNVYPDRDYYFVINMSSANYLSFDMSPTDFAGDNDGRIVDGLLEAQISVDASCRQFNTPVEFGFISSGDCGDGFNDTDGPNDIFGDFDDEQCDDGNTASGDGCSASCKVEYCGDGLRDLNGVNNIAGDSDDEVCDFGTTYNDGASQSTSVAGYAVFNPGSVPVCEEADFYTCSNDCKVLGSYTFSQPNVTDVTLQVFNDQNSDGIDGSPFNGIVGVNVSLIENNGGVVTAVDSEVTSNVLLDDGDADFTNIPFYIGRSYHFKINASKVPLNGTVSTTHYGTNNVYGVPITMQACGPTDDEIGFMIDNTTSFCGDGTLDVIDGETCDWGVNNGNYSTNATSYIPFANAPICQPAADRHLCTNTCVLISDVVATACPTCTDADHVICSENATVYASGQTYAEDNTVTSAFCGHDGTNWAWRSGISNLINYEADSGQTEICSGGANSIDQNCNAHESFTRFANGSVDYNTYESFDGSLLNVIRDVDAFDAVCGVTVLGYVTDSNSLPVSNVAVKFYIVSPTGEDQFYIQTMTNGFGYYAITGLPATLTTIFPEKSGYNAEVVTANLTTYGNTYEYNFTLINGNCNNDCTTVDEPGLCDASCDGQNFCQFYNSTVAGWYDQVISNAEFYDETLNLTMHTCEGQPIPGNNVTSGVAAVKVACEVDEGVVINDANNALHNGKIVDINVVVCPE